jgi:ADP-ribosylglycohydrolase
MSSPQLPADHAARMERLRLSLDGLSVGDVFGQHFFNVPNVALLIAERAIPFPRWRYTDDTEMALAIAEVLHHHGSIHQDNLARVFHRRYKAAPNRGYGATAHQILLAVGDGLPWSSASHDAFDGEGSMGNGGAMRVAPLGAYFADDFARVVREANASAEVTHGHPDGQAGAIAVAVAAAWAWRVGQGLEQNAQGRLLDVVLSHTPNGDTRRGLEKAISLPADASVIDAEEQLGSGQRVISSDTVPFSLWCASRHLDNYQEAMWTTVAGLGDRDTTCAIVGGIVALSAGRASIPAEWLSSREPLQWEF